jgi:hypothetical protein
MEPRPVSPLDSLVTGFAAAWLRIDEPAIGDMLVADPVLVLGPGGTAPVRRAAFLAAVAGRRDVVSGASNATALTGVTATPLGERMAVATISWSFGGDDPAMLVSDFLLQREGLDGLRCVAYLPRTNVLDHVARQPGRQPPS